MKKLLNVYYFLIFLHFYGAGYASDASDYLYNVHVKNIVLDHRFDLHKVEFDLSLSESTVENYPTEELDLELLHQKIVAFVENYEDKAAYWEILNRNLILHILEEFPTLSKITSHLKIFATPTKPHDRSTIVCYDKTTEMTEHFSFELEISPIHSLSISFDYIKNIPQDSYPNFFDIKGDLVQLFEYYDSKENSLRFLHESLETLLKKYVYVSSFKIKLKHLLLKEQEREDHCGWSLIVKRDKELSLTKGYDGIGITFNEF